MKIAVLPQDDKSRSKPFYSLLVGLGYTQYILYIYIRINIYTCYIWDQELGLLWLFQNDCHFHEPASMKKPHLLDILGNACCSTPQRTRSGLCLMILPHKQGLKNANEHLEKMNLHNIYKLTSILAANFTGNS